MRVVKVLAAAIIVLTFIECSKKLPQCEKWEVVDERFNIGGCFDYSNSPGYDQTTVAH